MDLSPHGSPSVGTSSTETTMPTTLPVAHLVHVVVRRAAHAPLPVEPRLVRGCPARAVARGRGQAARRGRPWGSPHPTPSRFLPPRFAASTRLARRRLAASAPVHCGRTVACRAHARSSPGPPTELAHPYRRPSHRCAPSHAHQAMCLGPTPSLVELACTLPARCIARRPCVVVRKQEQKILR